VAATAATTPRRKWASGDRVERTGSWGMRIFPSALLDYCAPSSTSGSSWSESAGQEEGGGESSTGGTEITSSRASRATSATTRHSRLRRRPLFIFLFFFLFFFLSFLSFLSFLPFLFFFSFYLAWRRAAFTFKIGHRDFPTPRASHYYRRFKGPAVEDFERRSIVHTTFGATPLIFIRDLLYDSALSIETRIARRFQAGQSLVCVIPLFPPPNPTQPNPTPPPTSRTQIRHFNN
jgi:hypothetical protein